MMSISTKGRYAARILVCLARHANGACLNKHEIGESEAISENYVEQIMLRLKAAHLVRSYRGRKGGFALTRPAEKITFSDVLRAVEGPVSPVPCLYVETCEREATCPTRQVWKETAAAVEKIFTRTTIATMAKQAAKTWIGCASYQI